MDALDYRSQQHLNMMIMSGRPSTDFAGGFAAARLGRPLTKYPAGGDGRREQFRSQRWMLGGPADFRFQATSREPNICRFGGC